MPQRRIERTIIGHPVTPALLQELNVLDDIGSTDEAFDPEGSWINIYRIWTCHGYREDGNANRGFLKIERKTGPGKKEFRLIVQQKILNDRSIWNVVEAEIDCRNDLLSTPLSWKLKSQFIGPDKKVIPDLGKEQVASVRGKKLVFREQGHKIQFTFEKSWTGDWSLFDSIQRFPFENRSPEAFEVLEGFSLLRKNQTLTYQGKSGLPGNDEGRILHRFTQIGHGTLPYDYWLDDRHRVRIVTTLTVAYILDRGAENKIGDEDIEPD